MPHQDVKALVDLIGSTPVEAVDFIAGGMENMSQAPHVLRGARGGLKLGPGSMLEDSLFAALKDTYCGFFMAQTSDNLARKYGLTRAQQDEFALRSHERANTANTNGRFAQEIAPVEVKMGKKSAVVEKDDHLFPATSIGDQLKQMQKLGGMGGVMGMLPGMKQMQGQLANSGVNDKMIRRQIAIINSMTPGERRNHAVINGSRRKRIARGSGTKVEDVNRVLKQFVEMKKMLKHIFVSMMNTMPCLI